MKKAILFLIICVLIIACKKTPITTDPQSNLLPVYSEKGSNTAGALINDTAWILQYSPCFSCYFYPHRFYSSTSSDSVTIFFDGEYTANSIRYIDTSRSNVMLTFKFVLKGVSVKTQQDLLLLNGKTFELDGINNYVIGSYRSNPGGAKGKGILTVKNAHIDYGTTFGDGTPDNPKLYRFVLSGLFNLNILLNNRTVTVKDGRFDMAFIQNANFYIQP